MESTSAVTGPRITGPRGVRVDALIDRDGSISTVGLTTPPEATPLEEITAAVTLLEVPGPAFSTPPSMLEAMISAELDCGLGVIGSGKERRAANVAEGSLRAEVRAEGSCVTHAGVALMIEELDGKAGIEGGLIGIGDRSGHLVQAEAREQLGFAGDPVVGSDGKLIGDGRDL